MTDHDTALEQCGLDSLDQVEFVMELEACFEVVIGDEDLEKIGSMSLNKLTDYIETKIAHEKNAVL